jgi:hypothetical protein
MQLSKAAKEISKILFEAERDNSTFAEVMGKLQSVRLYGTTLAVGIVLGIMEEFIENKAERKKIRELKDFNLTDDQVQEIYDRVNVSWDTREN